MSKPKLTILINTLTTRFNFISSLIEEIEKQSNGLPVEILYLGDNRSMTIGYKRNQLKRMAIGDYSCWIDDDDWIVPTYIQHIMAGIEHTPDIVTFDNAPQKADGTPDPTVELCKFRISHTGYHTDAKNKVYYFLPNQIHPIKKEIVDKHDFHESSFMGCDRWWAEAIKPDLKTEYYINKALYIYRQGIAPDHIRTRIPLDQRSNMAPAEVERRGSIPLK